MLGIAPALLALLFAVTFAAAADDSMPAKEKKPSKAALEKYDANKDGALDEAETKARKADIVAKAKATKEANLAKYDRNKDGKLDEAEKAALKADEDAVKAARKAEKQAAMEAKKAAKTVK